MPLLSLQGVSLDLPFRSLLSNLSLNINEGQRIGIVGANGSGKSTLLRLLAGQLQPHSGQIWRHAALQIGYLPQHVASSGCSGGETMMQAIMTLIDQSPELLLLDEPGNHLDQSRRRYLLRRLTQMSGAVCIVSHDAALLDACCDTLWHVEHGAVSVHAGSYASLCEQLTQARDRIDQALHGIAVAKRKQHDALMKAQTRAANARQRGEKAISEHRWATIKSATKLGRGVRTGVDQGATLRAARDALRAERANLGHIDTIAPTFSLGAGRSLQQTLVQISHGSVTLGERTILRNLNLSIERGQRIALLGPNGSGKSSLLHSISGHPSVTRLGDWHLLPCQQVARLAQHGLASDADLTGTEWADSRQRLSDWFEAATPDWEPTRRMRHLADFLLADAATQQLRIAQLSGGERVRLALASIAARTPELLLLDELGNHLDHITRRHVIDVLRAFPGALILATHDTDLLSALHIATVWRIEEQSVSETTISIQ